MPTDDDSSILEKLRSIGEERLGQVAEEILSSPKFTDALGQALQAAADTKGRVDRNIESVLQFMNVPTRNDLKKLATKIEALQGSLVNLNIKLDRLLAQTKPPRASSDSPGSAKAS